MQNLLLLVVITIASVYYCNSYQHIKKSLHNNYSIRFNNYYNNNKINNCNSHLEMSKVSSSWFESDDDLGDPSEIEDAFGMPVPPLPSVSSKINYGEETPNILYDLWVIGSGTLGELIVKRWKELYPDAKIIAETKTDKRHDSYLDMDVLPRLREIRSSEDIRAAKNVVICLPPSSSEDYVTEVSDGVSVWAGPSGGGSLLYTSSIGVYGESNGNTITESFRVDTRSKSSTKMLAAEEAIIIREGNVVRLSGLYTESRGPHTFWLKKSAAGETIDTNADGMVNMLHYEDAAEVAVKIICHQPPFTKRIFIASDDEPISKREICSSAMASKLFPDAVEPKFSSESGPVGKICDDTVTRKDVNWEPKYKSFRSFMRRLGGEDVENKGTREERKKKEEKKSALWIPGDDDDELF